jgi:predicted MFS family arabinose efflux permease
MRLGKQYFNRTWMVRARVVPRTMRTKPAQDQPPRHAPYRYGTNDGRPVTYGDSRSPWPAISLAIGGVVPILGMPIIVEGLENHWFLSAAQAGYVTSIDLAGLFVGSSITSALALKVHWRAYLLAALLLASGLNACCMLHPALAWLWALRFGAGTASGAAYASSLALLSRSRDTAHAFSLMIFSQVVANALILAVFPIIDDAFGPAGLFAAVGAVLASTLCVVPMLPGRLARPIVRHSGHQRSVSAPLLSSLCLSAVAFVYLAIGSYWAYAERMGQSAGIPAPWVHRLLSAGVLLSGLGCVAAFRLSRRMGQSRPLLIALGALAAVLLLNGAWRTPAVYVFTLATLQLCWNFIDIFQLGTLSAVDPSGRAAAFVPAAQGVGLAAGPAAGAMVLSLGHGYSTVLLTAGASATIAACCYTVVYLVHDRGQENSAAAWHGGTTPSHDDADREGEVR